jgi:hypothetical protein
VGAAVEVVAEAAAVGAAVATEPSDRRSPL